MPFKSLKQERFFNANKAELESKGVNVDEWNRASKGMSLPDYASPAASGRKRPDPSSIFRPRTADK
jgi:hypothetical protein